MKSWLTGIVCLLALLARAEAQTLTPSQFTQEFARFVSSAMPDAKMAVTKDLEVAVTYRDGRKATGYLANIYELYLQNPENLKDILGTHAASLVSLRGKVEKIDRERIVPMIKDRGWLDRIRKSAKLEPASEEFTDELVIVYAQDSEHGIGYFASAGLKAGGVDRAGLRELAVNNLRKALPKIELVQLPPTPIMVMSAGGDYDASLLLLDDIWRGDQVKVDGDIVVAIPARDMLLITGSRNRAGVAALRKIAKEPVEKSPHALTATLYVYRGGKFKRYGRKPKSEAAD